MQTCQRLLAPLSILVLLTASARAAQPPPDDAKAKQLANLITESRRGDATSRVRALNQLGQMGADAKPAGEAIVEALLDKAERIHKAAADALEKVHPDIAKVVVTLVVDQHASRRIAAARDLAALGGDARPAVPALLAAFQSGKQALNRSESPQLALVTLEAAVRVGPDHPQVVKAVLDAVTTPKPGGSISRDSLAPVRRAALGLLMTSDIDVKQKLPALLKAAEVDDCRVDALRALGDLGAAGKPALPALQKFRTHPNQTVRDAAAEAIGRIEKG